MKLETLTLLEEASWIALLLDPSGHVVIANETARSWLGIRMLARPSFSAFISSSPNGSETDALALVRQAHKKPITVQLRVGVGPLRQFQMVAAPLTFEGETFDLVQCFADTVVSPTANPAAPPAPKEATSIATPATAPTPTAIPAVTLAPAPATETAPPPITPTTPPPLTPSATPGSVEDSDTAQGLKQKLDCALQLTRTVALDFNNALTSILGHTSHLLSKTEPTHPWRGSLIEVEKSAEKAAEIAHDLATFSREEKENHLQRSGNINDVIRQTVELFQKNQPSGVTWLVQLENHIYTSTYDEAKIQQALLKMLENSIQAIGDQGTILVSSANVNVDSKSRDVPKDLPPGPYLKIEVIDDGPGIPANVLNRVFEPFFTTKPNPPHRGLGLAWVYGIVTNHGGRVALESIQGQGCQVTVYLPAHQRVFHDQGIEGNELEGNARILIVDDEDLILTMAETILSSYGYQVTTAACGDEALKRYDEAEGQFDLVITDMVMPNMGGRELMERLRQRNPKLKIICSTGYVRNSQTASDEGYLLKPFTSQDLLRKVKQSCAS